MGFWDNVKNFFSFGKYKTKVLPEIQSETNIYSDDNTITLTRMDGSQFMLKPICDRTGNQCFKEVIHYRTGESHLIPEFSIIDENLKDAQTNQGSDISKILMEIDFEQLRNNEEYQYQVANYLLPSARVNQIVDEYENYAGSVSLNQEGKLQSKFSTNIVKGLQNARQMNQMRSEMRREQEENARAENIYANAKNLKTNIKTSHAGVLNGPCPYGDER